MMKRSLALSAGGFTLVDTVISAGLSALLMLVMFSVLALVAQAGAGIKSRQNAVDIRSLVLAEIYNPAGWKNTVMANESLSCLTSLASPCPNESRPLLLMDSSNQVFMDPNNPSLGIDRNGAKCDTFGTVDCPFQMQVSWKPICQYPECLVPQIEIRATVKQGTNLFTKMEELNVVNYSLRIVRDVERTADRIAEIIAGGYSYTTCAHYVDGTAKCWGKNDAGQLGDGTNNHSGVPVDVQTSAGVRLTGIRKIALMEHSSCALQDTGKVFCWGKNNAGQLGYGIVGIDSSYARSVQMGAGDLTSIVDVVAGADRICAKAVSGEIYCWGDSGRSPTGQFDYMKLGTGAFTPGSGLYALDYRYFWTPTPKQSQEVLSPVLLQGTPAFVGMPVLGPDHTCVIKTNNKVNCWGKGNFANLTGVPAYDQTAVHANYGTPIDTVPDTNTPADPLEVITHYQVSCARLTGGSIYCWGCNEYGAGGINEPTDIVTTGYVVEEGTLAPLTNVSQAKAGSFHFCSISAGNKIHCWGSNSYGQIGDGGVMGFTDKQIAAVSPVGLDGFVPKGLALGNFHTCALFEGDIVKCWGFNTYGQLGSGSPGANSNVPVDVVGL